MCCRNHGSFQKGSETQSHEFSCSCCIHTCALLKEVSYSFCTHMCHRNHRSFHSVVAFIHVPYSKQFSDAHVSYSRRHHTVFANTCAIGIKGVLIQFLHTHVPYCHKNHRSISVVAFTISHVPYLQDVSYSFWTHTCAIGIIGVFIQLLHTYYNVPYPKQFSFSFCIHVS